MFCRFGFHFPRSALKTLEQQILQVPSDAIGADNPKVMDMKITVKMRALNIFGVNLIEPVNFADLGGNVIIETLQGKTHVAVFFYLPIRLGKILLYQIDIEF